MLSKRDFLPSRSWGSTGWGLERRENQEPLRCLVKNLRGLEGGSDVSKNSWSVACFVLPGLARQLSGRKALTPGKEIWGGVGESLTPGSVGHCWACCS